jgi:hypothetical protein
MDLKQMREDCDWKEAFSYAGTIRTATGCPKDPFTIDDVSRILRFENGENDGPSWIMVGRLKDGRYFFLDAGCDYTGWDCQAGGDAQVADTLDNLIRYGMYESARDRLKYKTA